LAAHKVRPCPSCLGQRSTRARLELLWTRICLRRAFARKHNSRRHARNSSSSLQSPPRSWIWIGKRRCVRSCGANNEGERMREKRLYQGLIMRGAPQSLAHHTYISSMSSRLALSSSFVHAFAKIPIRAVAITFSFVPQQKRKKVPVGVLGPPCCFDTWEART